MADQVLDFLNRPVEEKKALPEDPVLSFLNRPVPGEKPAATEVPAAQPESEPLPSGDLAAARRVTIPTPPVEAAPPPPQADLAGLDQPEFTPPPVAPVAVASPAEPAAPPPKIPELKDTPPVALSAPEEQKFQDWVRSTNWFKEFAGKYGEAPDLNSPDYDLRKAWQAGVVPQLNDADKTFHWSDSAPNGEMLKSVRHSTAWMEPFMRQYPGVNPEDQNDPRVVAYKDAWQAKYPPSGSAPADLSGLVQPEFGPQPALPVASLAEIAAGQGAGGGGGSGWGAEVQPLAVEKAPSISGDISDVWNKPGRGGISGAVDKLTDAFGKVLGGAAVSMEKSEFPMPGDEANVSPLATPEGRTGAQTVARELLRGAIKALPPFTYDPVKEPDAPQWQYDTKILNSVLPTNIQQVGDMITTLISLAGWIKAGQWVVGKAFPLVEGVGARVAASGLGMFGYGAARQAGELAGKGEPATPENIASIGGRGATDALFGMGMHYLGELAVPYVAKMFDWVGEKRATSLANKQMDTLRSDLTQAYKDAHPPEAGSLATGGEQPSDAVLQKWWQGLEPTDQAWIAQNSKTFQEMKKTFPDIVKGGPQGTVTPEAEVPPAATAKGAPPPEESVNLAPEAGPAAPEASTATSTPTPETPGPVTPTLADVATTKPQTMGTTGSVVTEAGSVKPDAAQPVAVAPEVYQEESGWWKVKGTDNKFSTQVAAQKAADIIQQNRPPTLAEAAIPDQPMGPTGTMTTEAASAEPAAPVDWQSNPSVQHFQAQGFEFVEAKTPEEIANLQAQGFEKAGVAPDLWFKRPAPVETPATTIAPEPNVQQATSDEAGGDSQAPVESQPLPSEKEPWEMTRDEHWEYGKNPRYEGQTALEDTPHNKEQWDQTHRIAVIRALEEGKPVPPEVLADYPDLAPKAATPLPSAFTGTPPQTRDKKITEHEDITGQTKINAVTYSKFADIVKVQDWPKVQEELTLSSANFTVGAFDHHFNPLSVMGRLEDGGLTHQEAKALVKDYEAQAFKPVREALAARRAAEAAPAPEAAATEYWPAKAEPRIKPLGPGRVEVSYYDGTEVQHHIVATIEEATALKDKVWTPAQAAAAPEVPKSAGERWGYGPAIEAKAKELGVEVPERTKPAPGDEVFKYATGFGGSDVVIRGTVTQNKMKELRVKLIDMSGMFGTTSLEKKKTESMTIAWTKKGEPAHRELNAAIREAEAKADKTQKQTEQEALAAKIHESKMAGNKHLDDLTPQPGMKIRDIETGKTGVIDSVKDYGIFATGIFDGATNPRSLGNQIGRYAVVPPKPLSSAITGKKTGPVAGAKPVAPRGAGLHPGIVGKPKAAPVLEPDWAKVARAGTVWDKSPANDRKAWIKQSGFLRESVSNLQWRHLTQDAQKALSNIVPTQQPAAPTFKAGDRVSFRNAGKDLTGTLENAPDKESLVDINVDVAGVKGRPPIGQVLMGFKVENLKRLPTEAERKEYDTLTERGRKDRTPEENARVAELSPLVSREHDIERQQGGFGAIGPTTVYPKPTGAPGRKVNYTPEEVQAALKAGDADVLNKVLTPEGSQKGTIIGLGSFETAAMDKEMAAEVTAKAEKYGLEHYGGTTLPGGKVSYAFRVPPAEAIDKSVKEPIISTTEATQAQPKGGKADADVTNRPGKTPENVQGSSGVKGSENVPPVGDGGKTGAVPEGPGRRDDGVVQPGGGSGPGGPGSVEEVQGGRGPGKDEGNKPGAPPVHGGSPGSVAGVQRPPDYRITPGELKRPGGWKATAAQNLDIIELAKKLEAEGRWATPEEQALLVQYTGFGAGEIRNNIFPRNAYSRKSGKIDLYRVSDEWRPLAEKLMEITTPAELAEIAQSTQYAHYTSESVIRSIYKAVERMGFPGGKILDPGAGNGLFGVLIPDSMRGVSKYTGIERDSVTALVAKHLLPNQNVMQADFIKQQLPDNFFDLGVGNPPFASTTILADPRYAKLRFALHDFFFAKGIDKIHPGGLQVFVTSRFTMDKAGDKARQYLADRADLIGAIRLPQTAFKANAGTEVVTDVLFLRKRAEGDAPGGLPWMEQGEVPLTYEERQYQRDPNTYQQVEKMVTQTKNVLINEYFVAHPEMILGTNSLEGSMYGENDYTVKPLDGNIEDHFAKAVENLPKNVYSIVKRSPVEQEKIVIERDFNPLVKKEGNVYVDAKGNLMVVEQGVGVSVDDVPALKTLSKSDKVWVRDYVPLRDALKKAAHDQRVDDPGWEASQKALIKVYDAFVKKHGQILEYTTFELAVKENGVQVVNDEGEPVVREYRRFKNARRMRADVESVLVYALEKITEQGEIIKDAALTRRFMKPPVRIEPKTPFEALAVTLDEVGKLDLDLIASKLNLPRAEVIEALGDMIYKAPGATWQTSDEYLSGDVKTKLEEAQAAAKADSQYQRNVEALQLVQPTPLTPAQVSVGLGASWIEPRYIMQFAHEIMDVEVPITFNAQINDWAVNTGRSARQRTTEWGTEDRSAAEILSHVLNNKNLVIKRTEADAFGVKHTFTDDAATTRVNEIAKRMKEAFATWVWSEKQRADDFLTFYDRKYNNLADRKFDGSHLSLPGLSISYPLHDHQKRAIWRAVVTGNTLLNHAVGSGKTLEQICIGQEMKRLGLIKRVLHVVPNHMLEQFSGDFMEAYPMANIMVADEQKFHMDNRRRFMAQASLNDPDAIIITHSALGKLPMKPENVKAVRDIFIRDLEDLLASLEEDPQANRILIAKVQRRIENMEQRFDSMTNASTDQAVFFEDFVGNSAVLILDESHEFRKLDFVTNRQAKGIDSNGSRKALDLYVKIKWLASQNEGRSHIFATGTPIVNTMGELYTLMRFFDDKGQMEADGIHFFDAWANMFGDMVSDWEKTGAGNWEEVSRFASFVNIPELMKRVKHFTDVLTPAQLGGYVNLPKIEGGQATLMLAPESKAVKDYQVQVLQPRLVRSRLFRPSPSQPGNPDPVINIITDGRLASIDMRYHYPNLPSDPTSKLNLMIDDIIEIHHRTADYPYFDKITGKEEPIRGAGQIVFYKLGFGKQITLNRKFDARAWVMKRFKEAGIPSSQVAWIDDYKTSTAKGQMSKEVRSGAKRILIGSMAKMGTGLNVQSRMFVSHLLDPPWFPADLEQAEGRTVRQGNQNPQVIMKRWASKGSYDSTMFQMVARKAKVIDQIWSGDDSLRTAQDVSRVSQYQMAAAYSSGDQRAIELAQAHGEVARLRRLRDAHHAEQRELRNKESNLDFWIPRDKVQLAENKAAAAAVGGYVRDVTAKIGKQAFTPEDKRADVGMALMQAINDEIASREADVAASQTTDEKLARLRIDSKANKIGDINGFDLLVTTTGHGDEVWAVLNVQVKTLNLWVQQGGAFPLIDTHGGTGLITRTINILNKVERDVSILESKLDEKKAELRRVQKRLGAPFSDEAALIEKEAEVSRLQRELAATGTVLDEEVGVDIAAGLAAEKTATYRTGPTIATALRRPLVAGARYRLGGTPGVESKTGRGTRGLPAAFTGKREIPNAEVRSQAADVAAAQPGNRSDNLPPAGTGTQRDLEDFKLRRRQEWFRPGKKEFAKLEYSETLAASPEFQEIVGDALAQGIKKVIPVKNAYFDGAIYPEKDGDVMLLNEELSESATHRQIVKHEGTHHLALLGDPVILSLIKAVDTKSDAFKAYREVLNSGYREAGMPRLSDRAMAEEVVADYRAGLTRIDLNGQEIHLGEAFQGPDSLKHLLAAQDYAHPAGGMEQAKTTMAAFRMKQPKVPITAKENQGIDKWLGEREISNFDSTVIAGKRQRAIMEALGKKKFDAEAKAIDNAMTHYIELKSFPEHVANYYADLKPEDQKAVDLAQHTIPKNPKLKAIADEIAAAYEVQGDLALDAEVVHELRDNYAAHIWNLDKGPSVEAQRKFATKTGHAQQRTFDTEIQGLAAGYEPLVRGATNKAMIYSQDVGHTIADRQFVVGERGKLFSKKQSDERPTQIQHPNMRDWIYAGNIEVESIITEVKKMSEEIKNSTKTSSTTTGGAGAGAPSKAPVEKMKEVIQNSLIIRGMTEDEANAYINRVEAAAVKAAAGVKATPGQAPPETTTTVIKELRETIVKIEKSQEVVGHKIKPVGRKDLFVNAKGDIFQKVPLFASKGAAEKLNNILGTSALKGIPFISKAIDVATRMKETILFLSGYHHQAGVRGWLLGVTGQGAKGLSPRKTYRQGLELINAMDPVIRHGVKTGGLVLGMTPEWRESLNHEKGKIGAYLDKNKVTKAIRDKVLALYDGQINFLFGKLFPGLQAMAYVTELKNFQKKFPGGDKDEAAKKVAALQNYNFGNLNYARMGRNPTLQHILRAVFLAPQWTESNYGPVRDMVGAFMTGDKESAYIYRKFWASVFAKGIAILLLGNLAMSLGDDKSAWESFKERWRGGRLRFLGLNITPVYRGVYHALGLEPSKSQKVFSPMGHFLDVIKMVAHPLLFLHHKGSPLYRVFHEAMAGVNWKGQAYTSAGDLSGATAGGSLKGKIVKEGKGGGAISWNQMPSFLLGQLRGSVPIPVGNLMGMLLGEMDGFDALTKSSGTMVSSFTPKTEAQGIISDYYQAALPNRNLTPEEKERKDLEKVLLKQARSGDMDGFTDALKDAVADGKLSTTAAKNLMKEAQHPEGVASFAKLPLEVALNAFEAASDQEKELWGPALIEKVARSQPETLMHNQASLQDIFRGLGMDDFADTLDELKIGDFTPGPLTSPDEYRGLASLDMGAVDSYLANKITGQAKKSKGPVKTAPRMTHPSKTGPTQKEKLRRLGLG